MKASRLSAKKDAAFLVCSSCGVPKVLYLFVAKFGSCIMDLPWLARRLKLPVLQDVAGVNSSCSREDLPVNVHTWWMQQYCSIVHALQGALLDAFFKQCFLCISDWMQLWYSVFVPQDLSNNTSINQKSGGWIRPWQVKGGTRTDQMRL